MLYWSVSGIDNANQIGNTGVGFATSVNLNRRLGAWELGGGIDYQQNVQTTFIGYMQSSYRWRSQVAHKLAGHLFWNGMVGGTQSVLAQQSGDGYNSQSFSSGIGNSSWSVNANYSQSSGTSVLTSTGVQPLPVTPGLSPSALILFNARSYGGT